MRAVLGGGEARPPYLTVTCDPLAKFYESMPPTNAFDRPCKVSGGWRAEGSSLAAGMVTGTHNRAGRRCG